MRSKPRKNPHHLIPHHNTWVVRLEVPKDLVGVFGKKIIKISTKYKLHQLGEAERKRDIALASHRARIKAFRSGDNGAVLETAQDFKDAYQNLLENEEELSKNETVIGLDTDGREMIVTEFETGKDIETEQAFEHAVETYIEGGTKAYDQEYARLWDGGLHDPHAQVLRNLDPNGIVRSFMDEVQGKRFDGFVDGWVKMRRREKGGEQKDKDIDEGVRSVKMFAAEFPNVKDVTWRALSKWITTKVVDEQMAPATVTKWLYHLRSYWKYISMELALSDTLRDIPPFNGHKIHKRQGIVKRMWQPADIEKLLTKKSTHLNQALIDLIMIVMFTGMRIEEICQLEIGDVVEEGNIWCLYITKAKSDRFHLLGRRHVPIHSKLEATIQRLIENSKDGYLLPSGPDQYGHRHGRYTNRFGRHKTKLGYEKYVDCFHGMRKTINTYLADLGLEKQQREAIVGWGKADNAMAESTYLEYLYVYKMSDRKADVEKLSNIYTFLK